MGLFPSDFARWTNALPKQTSSDLFGGDIMLCNVVYSVFWPDKLMDSHVSILRQDLHPANETLPSNARFQPPLEAGATEERTLPGGRLQTLVGHAVGRQAVAVPSYTLPQERAAALPLGSFYSPNTMRSNRSTAACLWWSEAPQTADNDRPFHYSQFVQPDHRRDPQTC